MMSRLDYVLIGKQKSLKNQIFQGKKQLLGVEMRSILQYSSRKARRFSGQPSRASSAPALGYLSFAL
jgi:hypothetical protein